VVYSSILQVPTENRKDPGVMLLFQRTHGKMDRHQQEHLKKRKQLILLIENLHALGQRRHIYKKDMKRPQNL
jgi:hypothetical protein